MGGVEGDGGDAGVVRQGILGVVEEDIVTTRAAARVQVAVATGEVVVSLAWDEVVGAPTVGQVVRWIGTRPDVEVGDGHAGVARAALLLVEQVDVIAARAAALIQVLADVRPALPLQVLYQGVERVLVAVAGDHHVGNEVRGRSREGHRQHHKQREGYPRESVFVYGYGFHRIGYLGKNKKNKLSRKNILKNVYFCKYFKIRIKWNCISYYCYSCLLQ